MNIQLKLIVGSVMIMALAGCTDLKPLQSEVATLGTQVTKLQADVEALKQQEAVNAGMAANAQKVAQEAANKATQALSEASAATSRADAVDVKMDRMFKHSVSK